MCVIGPFRGLTTVTVQIGTDSNLPIADASVEEFDKLAHVNTRGTMLCVRAISKAMSKQEPLIHEGRRGQRSLGRGSIINITSVMSFIGARGKLPYAASKHAVMGMTKTAGKDCRHAATIPPR